MKTGSSNTSLEKREVLQGAAPSQGLGLPIMIPANSKAIAVGIRITPKQPVLRQYRKKDRIVFQIP